jgi:hypothetical protein
MKFDPKKPHGVITGHSWARFEQNGILYNQQGEPEVTLDVVEDAEPEEIEVLVEVNEKDFELNNAKDFLKNILADGPLPRSVIFKECSANNQQWEKVKTAFADMGGEALTRRNVIHWKLKTA